MSQHNTNVSVYKSRRTILDILKSKQEYNVDDYINYGINEIHVMVQNKQLDMLLTKNDGSKKVYIKYHLGKTLRPNNIYEYIEDLFELEKILTKNDDLIIIMKDEPNETIIKLLKDIYQREKYFIIVFNIQRLQFNILEHAYVPSHTILDSEQTKDIKHLYHIEDKSQLPEISRFDPVAKAIGIRPGEICEIIRPSKTAITSQFYRICSQ
jgi:DNA-directed RNA polymerases I, II, and III subunit RPABC1